MGEITYSFEEEIVKMGDPNYSLILVGEERYNNMVTLLSNKNEKEEKLQNEINNLKRINQILKDRLLQSVISPGPGNIPFLQAVKLKARALRIIPTEAHKIMINELREELNNL